MKNMTESVTAKEAAFMLDTDMEQDMKSYREEVTLHVIKTINKHAELYKDVKFGRMNAKTNGEKEVFNTCLAYAKAHNNEFGDLFVSELEYVDWQEVIKRV